MNRGFVAAIDILERYRDLSQEIGQGKLLKNFVKRFTTVFDEKNSKV